MRKTYREAIAMSLLVALSSGALLQAEAVADVITASAPADGTVPPAMADSSSIPPEYDTYLLEQGRIVYVQLEVARKAAMAKDKWSFISAVGRANEALKHLEDPHQIEALEKQMGVIHRDIGKPANSNLKQQLWVPVQATLDAGSVSAGSGAHSVLPDKTSDSNPEFQQSMEVIKSDVTYSLGMFPLLRVKEDMNSAMRSIDMAKPYWPGALEAIESALESFHWYQRVPDQGLLTAYSYVVDAYALATGSNARGDKDQEVLNLLQSAAAQLANVSDGEPLLMETKGLIDKITPKPGDINLLAQHIQEIIRVKRQQSQDQYWSSVAKE